ncbi:MAG TPA: 30S ribosome-binding factor RbfA [Elusimicrobiota bacterium]|nr:30S ribosome-binding factor RbfA [Elusimicrobiota bacterium]
MFERRERLQELFHQEIASTILTIKDPGLQGFLTVTGVYLSHDQKNLRVFYSILGNVEQKKNAAKALERAAPYLRQVIKKHLSLRTIPNFIFEYDDTPARAARVDRILKRLEEPGTQ